MGHSITQILSNPDAAHKALHQLFNNYGPWAYAILFLIVFCETGLVVTPFLPGDSLLFALGAVAQSAGLNPGLICVMLVGAALLGDNCNYFLGCKLGRKLFHHEKSKIFNRKALDRTHAFFEKYGGRTVIIARFLPVFRTFAPFVAGMGKMSYQLFIAYSFLAASLWVTTCISIGYFAGRTKFAEKHFGLMLLLLIVISAVPGFVEIARHWRRERKEQAFRAEQEALEKAEVSA